MRRTVYNEDHESFRALAREFVERELAPKFQEYEDAGRIDKAVFAKMGELGLIGLQIPEEFGGGGQTDTFKYNAILTEETARACTSLGSLRVHQDVVTPYILEYATHEQKGRWLPGMANGTLMAAIAMTEPGTGSDLTGIRTRAEQREDGAWVLNGSKTFISGGANADLVLVIARTSAYDPDDRRGGLTIFVVPTDSPGFEVGRGLQKIGIKSQDTVELHFTDLVVADADVLGEPGRAFEYMSHNLAQERLTIAVNAVSTAQAAIRLASEYAQERTVVRPAPVLVPEHEVRAGGVLDGDGGRAGDARSGTRGARRGRAEPGRRRAGEAVHHRGPGPGHRQLPAGARRLRLHPRVPDRPPLHGCAGHAHLRRHVRGHEDDHREGHGAVGTPVVSRRGSDSRTGPEVRAGSRLRSGFGWSGSD